MIIDGNHYLLFGGGPLLIQIAEFLKQKNLSFYIITSPRHMQDVGLWENGQTLSKILASRKFKYLVSDNVNTAPKVSTLITPRTIGISIGAAWIFDNSFIKNFSGNLFNLHGSRLPQDRGGGGFSWRILQNDRLGFSLIHQIAPGIDTGDIVLYENYMFPASCRTPLDFEKYKNNKYLELVARFIDVVYLKQEIKPLSQIEYFSSYWPRLNTNVHAYINWSWELEDLERFICAFDDPYTGAQTFLDNKQVRLKKCFTYKRDGIFHPFQTGLIYRIDKTGIFIACQTGSLVVTEIYNQVNKLIPNPDFLGQRLNTPQKYLEQALTYRAVYTPRGLKEAI
jgi:methionyl-tRNA formyltransferase